ERKSAQGSRHGPPAAGIARAGRAARARASAGQSGARAAVSFLCRARQLTRPQATGGFAGANALPALQRIILKKTCRRQDARRHVLAFRGSGGYQAAEGFFLLPLPSCSMSLLSALVIWILRGFISSGISRTSSTV